MPSTPGPLNGVAAINRNGASLRDPAGYVFEHEGRIFRQLEDGAGAHWTRFAATPLAQRLFDQGLLIPTRAVQAPDAGAAQAGLLLEHERVDVLSHAVEWSFSMLRDAALLHLDLMDALVPQGWILKDAHPSNVQWQQGRLCLIDVASIEPYQAGAWRAYGQFCRTLLFPLMASAYGPLPLQALLRGFGRNGMAAGVASGLIGHRHSLKPGVLAHVRLQAWLQGLADRRAATGPQQAPDQAAAARLPAQALLRLLQGVRHALQALPLPRAGSWSGYLHTSTYSDAQLAHKQQIIDQWCAQHMGPTDTVLDVGCNTGAYSSLLARHVGRVVAIDADMPCIDEIYRRAEPKVLPLVVDFADPTPATGWALNEQQAFGARVRPQWSVWLAVIHHLAVHNGVRLDEVVRQMLGTSPQLIVEFVAPQDDMVRALLSERGIDRPDYTEAAFVDLLRQHAVQVLAVQPVTPTRTLYLLRRDGLSS